MVVRKMMKRFAVSITGLVLLSLLPGLALSATGGPNAGGECQGVPIPPPESMNENDRIAFDFRIRFETGPAECSRLGGIYVQHARITADQRPVYTRRRAIEDYRQAMSDWRSSDSCDKLAAKMKLVGQTIVVAGGLAMIANPNVGAMGVLLGYTVTVQGEVVGTWICTDD